MSSAISPLLAQKRDRHSLALTFPFSYSLRAVKHMLGALLRSAPSVYCLWFEMHSYTFTQRLNEPVCGGGQGDHTHLSAKKRPTDLFSWHQHFYNTVNEGVPVWVNYWELSVPILLFLLSHNVSFWMQFTIWVMGNLILVFWVCEEEFRYNVSRYVVWVASVFVGLMV